MEESAPYGTFSLKKGESVTGLRERRCTPKPTNDCYPTRRCGLPCALIFTAHIGAVDHLIAIDRVSVHHHAQRGIDGRLEAHRNLSKVKIDVGHDLTRLHGNGVEAEAVVVAGEQVARQHLIARVVIGFVEDTVVEPCAVSAGGERRGTRHIIGDLRRIKADRLMPDTPIKARSTSGRAVRHKITTRTVRENGRCRTGTPTARPRMTASIVLRVFKSPPKSVPPSIKLGGIT